METVYSKTTEIGRIGMKVPTAIEVPTELPEHKKGYHPTKCLPKKKTSFWEGVCHVRFDRKTLPKSGKNIIDNCFIENKKSYWLIWDKDTRALLSVYSGRDVESYVKTIKERWKEYVRRI